MHKRVLSLGGGVQSTALALLMHRGKVEPPDIAIFADTGWEPKAVYETVEWLMHEIDTFPIVVTRRYNKRRNAFINLREDILDMRGYNGFQGAGGLSIPLYGVDKRGKRQMFAQRRCTANYKIQAIEGCARALLYQGKSLHKRYRRITQILGISTDEWMRAKDNRHSCIDNEYPLIDLGLSRRDCLAFLRSEYPDRNPSRSACVACPYRSADEWVAVRETEPALFAEAVALDEKIRNFTTNGGQNFMHRRLVPLDKAVDMDAKQLADKALQYDFGDDFNNECEGHCGL